MGRSKLGPNAKILQKLDIDHGVWPDDYGRMIETLCLNNCKDVMATLNFDNIKACASLI